MVPPGPHHPFLLVLVFPLVTALSPGQPIALCPASCRCHWWLLDCSRASMAVVPRATRRWALSALNFTGNSISSIEKEVWREYPWAEHLVLQDNDLRVVKSHSLEGLLLLKHLDLSGNKILSIEERAFEPLPFLQLLNLSGNLMARIQKDTFQAWHGMQFLQKVILSHNPLSVIDDASFFRLPAVSYLDLAATRVSPLTVLKLLLSTARLEMLKLPPAAACCLCREGRAAKALCRSVHLHGKEPCASAPQCAHVEPPAEVGAELRRAAQRGTVLRLNLTSSSLGDIETVTLHVVLSPCSAGGVLRNSSYHSSRMSPRSPQHPGGQELRSAPHKGRQGGRGGRKVHFPATEPKEEQQSGALWLPRPAARKVLEGKEGAHVPREPSSTGGTEDEDAAMEGDLFEREAERRLRSLVPNAALRGFVARVARAARRDGRLQHLQPSCTKLLAQTGRLVGLLGRPRPTELCSLRWGNSGIGTGSSNRTGEGTAAHSSRRLLLAVSVSLIVTAYITAICLIEVCCPKPSAASQPHSTSKSQWRRFFKKLLPHRRRRNDGAQGLRFAERTKDKPQDLCVPLDDPQRNCIHQLYREPEEEEEEEEEEEVFSRAKLPVAEQQHSPSSSAP